MAFLDKSGAVGHVRLLAMSAGTEAANAYERTFVMPASYPVLAVITWTSPASNLGLTDAAVLEFFSRATHPLIGLLMILNGVVQYAFFYEISADRVRIIDIICNPDKLQHLHSQAPC